MTRAILKKSPQWKWNDANRHKLQAHQQVRVAVRNGVLKRGKCEVCGSLRVDAHHDDYSQPLKVRWLSRACHQRLHVLLAQGNTADEAIAILKAAELQRKAA